jgi:hypothetical protein
MSRFRRKKEARKGWRIWPPYEESNGWEVRQSYDEDRITLTLWYIHYPWPIAWASFPLPGPGKSLSREVLTEMSEFLKKLQERTGYEGPAQVSEDPWLAKHCPSLHDLLFCTLLDGKRRQTATLSVTVFDGRLRVFVNDRESGLSLAVTLRSAEKLWEQLEKAVGDPTASWRKSSANGQPRKKGKF